MAKSLGLLQCLLWRTRKSTTGESAGSTPAVPAIMYKDDKIKFIFIANGCEHGMADITMADYYKIRRILYGETEKERKDTF